MKAPRRPRTVWLLVWSDVDTDENWIYVYPSRERALATACKHFVEVLRSGTMDTSDYSSKHQLLALHCAQTGNLRKAIEIFDMEYSLTVTIEEVLVNGGRIEGH